MQVIDFSPEWAEPIHDYGSTGASRVPIGHGTGAMRAHCIHFRPGSNIGEHEAGPNQLFLVVEGEGWVAGADGRRLAVRRGQGALFEAGELHSKGSDSGMIAIVIQVSELSRTDNANAG